MKKAIKVEGSVQEHGTGKPAARVKVNLDVLKPEFRSEDVITDDAGQFSRYVLPCKLRVSLTWFSLPDRYFHAPRRPLGRLRCSPPGRRRAGSPRWRSGRRSRSRGRWSTRRASRSKGSR